MKFRFLFLLTLSLFSSGGRLIAQELTAEQQAKLNALPPSLQAQAIDELRKYQASQGSANQSAPMQQPQVVVPTNAQGQLLTNAQGQLIGPDGQVISEFLTADELEKKETENQKRTDKAELKPFGYDLFRGAPTTFAPVTEIPIPVDYIIGPGDQVRLQYYGKQQGSYDLYVTREGILQVPQIGPINVAGQSFQELKDSLNKQIADQMIGVNAFITLGELRSIRVFVLGDVNRPGAYTVSSLSTMTNALFVSGGIKEIGSLRNIQLKRSGEIVQTLDLYDLLLRGDTSNDASLKPGDAIFVPPVGTVVGVRGEVQRPAIYELLDEGSVSEVIAMAGGQSSQAYPKLAQIERIGTRGMRQMIDIDLTSTTQISQSVANGDTIRVYSALERFANVVSLEGAVERPGNYQWQEGIRVSDILTSVKLLQPYADTSYGLIVSKNPINGRLSTQSFDLERLFLGNNEQENPTLAPEDRIIVFDDREEVRFGLQAILDRLKVESTSSIPQKIVSISGKVRHPGDYPLDEEMTVSRLIRAAGGFAQDAFTLEGELLRYQDNGKTMRESIVMPVNLAELQSNPNLDLSLRAYDVVNIRRVPEWTEAETIKVTGEVRFPGEYTIERGETLSDILERAGGVTELAHPKSAIYLRESLRKSEEENLVKLRERLRGDIATASLEQQSVSTDSIRTAESLLDQLETTKAVGRLVIDLDNIIAGNDDVLVKDGDSLIIPQKPQAVTILGSVNYPTSHLHEGSLGLYDYINLSGGLMKNADKKQIYVVRSNGRVEVDKRSRFFPRGGLSIYPGDTIVVPIDVDRLAPLKLWTATSQIFYQIALGAAAINSF